MSDKFYKNLGSIFFLNSKLILILFQLRLYNDAILRLWVWRIGNTFFIRFLRLLRGCIGRDLSYFWSRDQISGSLWNGVCRARFFRWHSAHGHRIKRLFPRGLFRPIYKQASSFQLSWYWSWVSRYRLPESMLRQPSRRKHRSTSRRADSDTQYANTFSISLPCPIAHSKPPSVNESH